MLKLEWLDVSLRTAYAQAKELALGRAEVPLVTAGSIHVEPRKGGRFFYRYRYDAAGKHIAEYIGPEDSPEAKQKVEEARAEIAEHVLIADYAKKLRRLGLYAADNHTIATVATLFNAGIFGKGAVLIGTHAFGALLNELGAIASPFPMTEDIDVARAHRIEVATFPRGGMLELLRQTGLPFLENPSLSLRAPPTSFSVRGRRLTVDLLVPSDDRPFAAIPVPELHAHATGLPHLRYLLDGAAFSMLVGRERLVPVTVPHAGRFCIHKLAVYSLRPSGYEARRAKDVLQAAALAAAIHRDSEWLFEEAADAMTKVLRTRVKKGAARAVELLSDRFPEAAAAVAALA